MERLAEAVGHLVDAMRLMGAEQDVRDRRMAEYEARLRELDAESQANRARINEIIGVLTRMQADIARLDAAS
ncbi:MAG: hypothetical protein OXI25_08475 [Chloroflexota bacterium]|nr:hypothetical protein [Chloroflexota bacterium]